jgi:hypothetical protein
MTDAQKENSSLIDLLVTAEQQEKGLTAPAAPASTAKSFLDTFPFSLSVSSKSKERISLLALPVAR